MPPTVPSKLLFITAGSGITPVMGMLRGRLTDPDVAADVVLLHSTPTREDVIFGDELRALSASGRIDLLERHTDTDGMLDLAELDRLVPDWKQREVWTCGPAGFARCRRNALGNNRAHRCLARGAIPPDDHRTR